MLFAIDIVCVAIVAVWVTRWLQLPTRPARIMALFLAVTATVIMAGEALGLVGQLYAGWFVLLHVAATLLVLWRGMPPAPQRDGNPVEMLLALGRAHLDLGWLGLAVAVAYAIGVALVLSLPPNNWDSMTYHLSRVGYWLQQRAFYPPWNSANVIQTAYPVNAELLLLWTVIFTGSDRLTGLVQWSASIVGMVAVFGTARLLRASRAGAMFAALVWASLPEIFLQSTTTQNDLLAAVLVLAACYFCALGFMSDHPRALVISGVALGLAVGTKLTVLQALPGIVLGALLLWSQRQVRRERLMLWLGACGASVIVLALHSYVANGFVYGNPFGPAKFLAATSAGADLGPALFFENAAKYLYQATDLTGVFPRIAQPLLPVKAALGHWLFSAAGLDPNSYRSRMFPPFDFHARIAMQEDLAWFGPLGMLLLFPVAVRQTIRAARRRENADIIAAAGAASFVLIACMWLRWQPWSGRYFVIAATLAAPLVAHGYGRDRSALPVRWVVALMASMCLANAALSNEMKPLIGPATIVGRDRVAVQTINRPEIEPVLRALEREVPETARVGTLVGDNWDYPVFGARFTRTVVALTPTQLTPPSLAQLKIDYVLLRDDIGVDVSAVLDGHNPSWSGGTMHLIALGRGPR